MLHGEPDGAQSREERGGPDWGEIRSQYPALQAKTYLDTACKGLPAAPVLDAVRSYLCEVADCPGVNGTEDTVRLFEDLGMARAEVARLLNCDPSCIALVESTTHGLQIAANCIGLVEGDNVVIDDLEFMGVLIPWYWIARSRGIELRKVEHRNGLLCPEDFVERMDERTRAVVLSSVQESNGFRADLGEMARICAERGAYLVVDAIQQVGVCALDVRRDPVDFLAAGGHKWLGSPFGTGFLYIRKELLGRVRPVNRGYMSVRKPPGGWDDCLSDPERSPFMEYEFVDDASKFEIGGTANFVGARALAASVRFLNGIGIANIESRIRRLTDILMGGLRELGMCVVTPTEPERRAGIVTFRSPSRSPAEDRRIFRALCENRIATSLRFTSGIGGIRCAVHFYNDEEDIERLLEVVRRSNSKSKRGG